jgi:hypothetical protein
MKNLVEPTTKYNYRPAKKRLKLWLKERGMRLIEANEWAYWAFSNRPFYSVWALVSTKKRRMTWGLNIYDDGEILMISELEG